MLAHLVFMSSFSRKFLTMTSTRKMINENTKAYCWLQTRIDIITPSTIYGATGDTNIIAPLLKDESTIGKRLPRAMTLNDNAIDYVHWDDLNELVDRMRLLETSRQASRQAITRIIMRCYQSHCGTLWGWYYYKLIQISLKRTSRSMSPTSKKCQSANLGYSNKETMTTIHIAVGTV